MAVSYNKLWKKLIDLEMSRTELRLKAGLSTRQLAKLGKNENVTTDVLVKVCKAARLYVKRTDPVRREKPARTDEAQPRVCT